MIKVHVCQMIDGEVTIDDIQSFDSKVEFEAAKNEAICNWNDMQGEKAIVNRYGNDLQLLAKRSTNLETWTVIR